ncbi:MAG: FtsH protease activity modulator HflK [Gammaproteobacteria bacterium]|nr:FtsH protease activity modulator HflK [Gammaproteobacteria bacterium]
MSNYNDNDDKPIDLEAFMKKIIGSSRKKRPSGGGEGPDNLPLGKMIAGAIVAVVLLWAISGIYIVQPAERAAILRFGKYVRTVTPGPHWYPRFIEKKIVVNVNQVNTISFSQLMLTQNENIVYVSFIVQYQIGNLRNYLFNVVNPVNSLQQILESAVRQEIGHAQLDKILTTGRAEVSAGIMKTMEQLIDRYKLGINLKDVTMQPATAPSEVKAAFDDVIKAREDKERFANEATSYANKKVPIARGQAARIQQEANAYKEQIIYRSKGDTAKFLALEPIYKQNPTITANRMYFTTMERVLGNSHLYVVDSGNGSHNLFYLPLDKLLAQQSKGAQS